MLLNLNYNGLNDLNLPFTRYDRYWYESLRVRLFYQVKFDLGCINTNVYKFISLYYKKQTFINIRLLLKANT